MKTIIEIRAGIGGDDSKMLIESMSKIYRKASTINNFSFNVLQ